MISNNNKKNIATVVATACTLASFVGFVYNNSREPPKSYSHEQLFEYNINHALIDVVCVAGIFAPIFGLGAYSRKLNSQ